MNGYVGWPDVVIIAILAIAAIKGFARGLLSELGGVVAVVLAVAAPFYYNGFFDSLFENGAKMNPGSAHITGIVVTGVIVYGIIMLLLWLIGRYTHLPALGAGNAIGGGIIGLGKGVILLWVALFVALLFPLTTEVRTDLHKSHLVAVLQEQNQRVDTAIQSKVPALVRPLVDPILQRENV
ncbi:MAG: CvpA family protein [Candidatus Tyrphobacter sp.]